MSYTQNVGTVQLSIAPPPGSIMAYLGTSSPDGWILLNGTKQSNSDGRYNQVSSMGIGKLENGEYTPPDYRGAFLRGTGTSYINGNYIGPSNVGKSIGGGAGEYQDCAVQQHQHAGGNHSHGISMYTGGNIYGLIANGYNTMNSEDSDGRPESERQPNLNDKVYLPRNTDGATAPVGNITGIQDYNIANQTMSFNFGVNWIMKL